MTDIRADETAGWRVIETVSGRELRWRDLANRLADADVVFVGEQHDDPQTHLLEARLFRELHTRVGPRLTLAMEMLERDGQTAVDDYASGRIDDAELAKRTTLWKTWTTDYSPMAAYAKARRLPIVASNAPQRIVRLVGRGGLAALADLSPTDRKLVAMSITAPANDVYADRFSATMKGDGGAHGMSMDDATVRKIYEAQCVRDDTMAESICSAVAVGRKVYHVNGSFHSDAGLGTAARVLWRRPLGTKIAIVKPVPVKDVRRADAAPLKGEAHFLVFVPDQRPMQEPAR